MSEAPQTIFQVSSPSGQELIRINAAGDFFVRGEEVPSTSIIRDAFLDYARLYVAEQVTSKTLVAVKSMVPTVLLQFDSEELRATPEFAVALIAAQTRPQLVFNYDGNDLHVHVLVGVLQEFIAELLQQKRQSEHAQMTLAHQLAQQSLDKQAQAVADEAEANAMGGSLVDSPDCEPLVAEEQQPTDPTGAPASTPTISDTATQTAASDSPESSSAPVTDEVPATGDPTSTSASLE